MELQLGQQVVFGLVEDVDGGEREAPRVCENHSLLLLLPLEPRLAAAELCVRRCGDHGCHGDVGQTRSQRLTALQQRVVVVTEEGVQRRRAGEADSRGHVDRRDGRRAPGAQDAEDPEDRQEVRQEVRQERGHVSNIRRLLVATVFRFTSYFQNNQVQID